MIGLMFIFSIIFILTGSSFVSSSYNDTFHAIVNGTTSDYNVEGTFAINTSGLEGALGWLLLIGGIAAVSGFAIIGTGLNESSSRVVWQLVFYISIWWLLSVLPFPYILSIPFGFGTIIYLIFTVFYAIFCIMSLGS